MDEVQVKVVDAPKLEAPLASRNDVLACVIGIPEPEDNSRSMTSPEEGPGWRLLTLRRQRRPRA